MLCYVHYVSGPEVLFQDLRRDEIRGWWWWWWFILCSLCVFNFILHVSLIVMYIYSGQL